MSLLTRKMQLTAGMCAALLSESPGRQKLLCSPQRIRLSADSTFVSVLITRISPARFHSYRLAQIIKTDKTSRDSRLAFHLCHPSKDKQYDARYRLSISHRNE